MTNFWIILGVFIIPYNAGAQLIVQEAVNETLLVRDILLGDGMDYQNVVYTGYDRSMGFFDNGDSCGLGINSGIILSSGVVNGSKGPNDDEGYTSGLGGPGADVLKDLAGAKTLDAAVLEFEFMPQADHVQFRYIFASDEYEEWVDKGFNDVFGFFISGPGIVGEENVALVPGTKTAVAIDNINHKRNTQYYKNNRVTGTRLHDYLQHDGQTVPLVADLILQPCKWYKIKLAVADVGDQKWDSWVFLEAESFKHATGLPRDTAYCTSDVSTTLNTGHHDKPVQWWDGDTSHIKTVTGYGTYKVKIFTDCGFFEDQVSIFPELEPIDLGKDTVICGNEEGPVLSVEGRVFQKYMWSTGETTPSIKASKPGTYILEVDNNGCKKSDTIEVVGKSYPQFDLGRDSLFCGKVDWLISAPITGDKYEWSDGSSNKDLQIDEDGEYWVKILKEGCYGSDTLKVTSRQDFNIDIGPDLIEYCAMRPTQLNTGLGASPGYEILWSTGDRSSSIEVILPGKYSVVVNDSFCPFSDSDEIEITAVGSGSVYHVPNAFSPNSDDLNEGFHPVKDFNDVLSYEFTVYNRWGQKVFESVDQSESWDGTFDGILVTPGVYFWHARIKTTCLDDNLHNQSGTVQVLR